MAEARRDALWAAMRAEAAVLIADRPARVLDEVADVCRSAMIHPHMIAPVLRYRPLTAFHLTLLGQRYEACTAEDHDGYRLLRVQDAEDRRAELQDVPRSSGVCANFPPSDHST